MNRHHNAFIAALLVAATTCGVSWHFHSGRASAIQDRQQPSASTSAFASARPTRPRKVTTQIPKLRKVTGRVVDEQGGRISEAEVCSWSDGDHLGILSLPNSETCLRASTSGEFGFASPPVPILTISVRAPGYQNALVQIDSQELDRRVDIVVRKGLLLRGSIVDAYGGPIAGARIAVVAAGEDGNAQDHAIAVAAAQKDGQFEVGVAEGQFEVHATAEGYGIGSATAFVPGPEVRVALAPASRVQGLVVDETGRGLPGIVVYGRREGWSGSIEHEVSGPDGAFTLRSLSTGTYSVGVADEDWEGVPARVSLDSGATFSDITLLVSRAATLKGHVLVGNEPCSRGEVDVHGPMVTGASTAPDGGLEIASLKPGNYEVTAHCQGAVAIQERIEFARGDRVTRTWKLERGLSIRGIVNGPSGAKPGLHVRVETLYMDDTATTCAKEATEQRCARSPRTGHHSECSTDVAGRFACSGLAPGHYRCSVRSGYREIAHFQTEVPVGEDKEVRWYIPAMGTIRAHVPTGARARADVVLQGSELVLPERSAPDTFVFSDVELGRYTVRYRTESSGVTVTIKADGDVVDVDLVAPVTATLEGVVLAAGDTPVPDAWIIAQPPGISLAANVVRTLTDAEGRFEVPDLPRGEYRVRVESALGSTTSEIRTGENSTIRLSPPVSSPH